ncbi:DUF2310 family Zn-ribbon-containing protein [Tumidithrix elongata]|uniref:DUF2310 family Zn-ribbon-containing protein n=1 Tax=Tumidithrix elongata TaxID=3088357 RepID=UPI0038CD1D69
MLSAELTFAILENYDPSDDEAFEDLLSIWYKNGQIETKRWHTVRNNQHVRVTAWLPDENALDAVHNNTYANEVLTDLPKRGFGLPVIRILGVDTQFDPPCSCPNSESLILITNYLSAISPFRCGSCFNPVALYRLPHTHDEEHLDVLHWASDYRACDTLQMHCTTGERFAESQLYRYDSSLSQQGKDIAAKLSTKIFKPVYYFLLKSRGKSLNSERSRHCPSCGGTWLLEQPWHGLFDFRCDRCSLLSNIACGIQK